MTAQPALTGSYGDARSFQDLLFIACRSDPETQQRSREEEGAPVPQPYDALENQDGQGESSRHREFSIDRSINSLITAVRKPPVRRKRFSNFTKLFK